MSDDPQDPHNLLPHRPAAQRGAVGGELLERRICVVETTDTLDKSGQRSSSSFAEYVDLRRDKSFMARAAFIRLHRIPDIVDPFLFPR